MFIGKSFSLLARRALLWLGLIIFARDLPAQLGSCPAGQPCFTAAYQSGNTVVFNFNGGEHYDVYHLRYKGADGNTKSVENTSGHFTFHDTLPNRVYSIFVQGCIKHTLGHDSCSDWANMSVTTKQRARTFD
jgi:hypothetical protein